MYKINRIINDFENMEEIEHLSLNPNPNAIHLLEANPDKIVWHMLSSNPNAIHLLEANQDKICWPALAQNPNAIQLIEQNLNRLNNNCWCQLAINNPSAVHLLEKIPCEIPSKLLLRIPFMLDYDYEKMKTRCNIYKEELIQKAFHPSRIQKLLDMGISIDELDNCI